MIKLSLRARLDRVLVSDAMWWILPTPATCYFNRVRLRKPMERPDLPEQEWSRRGRHSLLSSSEERLRGIEGKGPGLATVSAVIVGAVLLALTSGWDDSACLGRLLLSLAALYGGLSLLMPLYLAGPIKRATLHAPDLKAAADTKDPEESLADRAAEAAMRNDLNNIHLTNLLDAARRELAYAFALLLLWALLVPVTGVFAS